MDVIYSNKKQMWKSHVIITGILSSVKIMAQNGNDGTL